MSQPSFTFRLKKPEDRKLLDDKAGLAGAGAPSVLLQNIVAAMRYMTPEELQELNTRAARRESQAP